MVHHCKSWKENVTNLKKQIDEVFIDSEAVLKTTEPINSSDSANITIPDMKVYIAILIVCCIYSN